VVSLRVSLLDSYGMIVQYPEQCNRAPIRIPNSMEETVMRSNSDGPRTGIGLRMQPLPRLAVAMAVAAVSGFATAQQIDLSFWTNLTTASQANVIQKQ